MLFWKLLDRLDTPKNDDIFKNSTSHRIITSRVFSVTVIVMTQKNPDCTQKGPLDGEITMTENHKATYILKLNKAGGYDVISNEMMLCLLQI